MILQKEWDAHIKLYHFVCKKERRQIICSSSSEYLFGLWFQWTQKKNWDKSECNALCEKNGQKTTKNLNKLNVA